MKGQDQKAKPSPNWEVPYSCPSTRPMWAATYEPIIRINSQSGKGGIAYVLSAGFTG